MKHYWWDKWRPEPPSKASLVSGGSLELQKIIDDIAAELPDILNADKKSVIKAKLQAYKTALSELPLKISELEKSKPILQTWENNRDDIIKIAQETKTKKETELSTETKTDKKTKLTKEINDLTNLLTNLGTKPPTDDTKDIKVEDTDSPVVGTITLEFTNCETISETTDAYSPQYIQLSLSRIEFASLGKPEVFKVATHLILNYYDSDKKIATTNFTKRIFRDINKLKDNKDKSIKINILKPEQATYHAASSKKIITLPYSSFREIEVKPAISKTKSYLEFSVNDIKFDNSKWKINFIFNTFTVISSTKKKVPTLVNLPKDKFKVDVAEKLIINLSVDDSAKLRYKNLFNQLKTYTTTDKIRVYILNSDKVVYNDIEKEIILAYESLGLIVGGTISTMLHKDINDLEDYISERFKEPYKTWFGGGDVETKYNEHSLKQGHIHHGKNWKYWLSFITDNDGTANETSLESIQGDLLAGLCEYTYPKLIQVAKDKLVTKEKVTEYLKKYGRKDIEETYWTNKDVLNIDGKSCKEVLAGLS